MRPKQSSKLWQPPSSIETGIGGNTLDNSSILDKELTILTREKRRSSAMDILSMTETSLKQDNSRQFFASNVKSQHNTSNYSMMLRSSAETTITASGMSQIFSPKSKKYGSFFGKKESRHSSILKSFLNDEIAENLIDKVAVASDASTTMSPKQFFNSTSFHVKKNPTPNPFYSPKAATIIPKLKQQQQLFPQQNQLQQHQQQLLLEQSKRGGSRIPSKTIAPTAGNSLRMGSTSTQTFADYSMKATFQKERNTHHNSSSIPRKLMNSTTCYLRQGYQRRKEPIYREIMADDLALLSIESADRMKIEVDFSPHYLRGNITRAKESSSNNAQMELQKLQSFVDNAAEMNRIATNLIEDIKRPTSSMTELYEMLFSLQQIAGESFNASLALSTKYIHAMLACLCGDKDISIKLWKEYLRLCNGYLAFYFKIIAYKNLGRIHLERGNYTKSLGYLKKLLKYAWLYDLYELENFAYEEISRAYYHLNEIDLTLYFHERAINYQMEPIHSSIRSVGVCVAKYEQERKRKMALDSTMSDDDFDLEGFKNAEFMNDKMQRLNNNNSTITEVKPSEVTSNHLDAGTRKKNDDDDDKDSEARFDINGQTEFNLKKQIKRHRLNKYKLDSSVTSLDGMKALAALKNKMSEPLGPIQLSSKYRSNAYVNLNGRINFTTENTQVVPKFIVYNDKNRIKAYDKIYVNHLSCSRRVQQLMNLANRLDNEREQFISNDCVRLTMVPPTMKRLITLYIENLNHFSNAALTRIQLIHDAK